MCIRDSPKGSLLEQAKEEDVVNWLTEVSWKNGSLNGGGIVLTSYVARITTAWACLTLSACSRRMNSWHSARVWGWAVSWPCVSTDDDFDQLAVMLASRELHDGEYDARRWSWDCGTAGRCGTETNMAGAAAASMTSGLRLLTHH